MVNGSERPSNFVCIFLSLEGRNCPEKHTINVHSAPKYLFKTQFAHNNSILGNILGFYLKCSKHIRRRAQLKIYKIHQCTSISAYTTDATNRSESLAAMMYDVGRKVEVSLDAEDCRGAWFPAIINEKLGNEAFVAEYSRADRDKKAQRLKIMVDSNHVRPSPPHLKKKHFVLLEKVDAYFDFGWWSGVITKELEGNRYIVFFKQRKRDKEFHQSELRPYVEWKDGKWFISSQVRQHTSTSSCTIDTTNRSEVSRYFFGYVALPE